MKKLCLIFLAASAILYGVEINPFGINLGIDKKDDHILVGAIYEDGSEFAIKSRINKKDVPNPDFNFDSYFVSYFKSNKLIYKVEGYKKFEGEEAREEANGLYRFIKAKLSKTYTLIKDNSKDMEFNFQSNCLFKSEGNYRVSLILNKNNITKKGEGELFEIKITYSMPKKLVDKEEKKYLETILDKFNTRIY